MVFLYRAAPVETVHYLEYIQSSGTQYIDTGFAPNQDTRVKIELKHISQPRTFGCFFGSRDQSSGTAPLGYGLWSAQNGSVVRSDFFGSSVENKLNVSGAQILADKNKNICTVNETILTNASGSGQATLPIFILACNDIGETGYYISAQVYYCQIYDNGTLVRDYWPAKDQEGVVCLYDRVNKEYAYNAGTGTFTAGPDL